MKKPGTQDRAGRIASVVTGISGSLTCVGCFRTSARFPGRPTVFGPSNIAGTRPGPPVRRVCSEAPSDGTGASRPHTSPTNARAPGAIDAASDAARPRCSDSPMSGLADDEGAPAASSAVGAPRCLSARIVQDALSVARFFVFVASSGMPGPMVVETVAFEM